MTAMRPLAFLSLPVIRRVLAALIFSIPPFAWMFLLTSSSAVWAQEKTLRHETATTTVTARPMGELLIFISRLHPSDSLSGDSVNPNQPGLLFLSLQRSWQHKVRGINGHVHLHLLHRDGLRIGIVLRPLRHRERKHHSRHRLVRPQAHHAITHRAPDKLLDLLANLDKSIRIEVVIDDVAVFQRYLQPQRIVPI